MTRKTKGFLLAIPLALLFSLAIYKRPVQSSYDAEFGIPASPVAFRTSLADTLPEKTFHELHIQDVEGVKVKYPAGNYASYFEYEADSKTVIDAISNQPFSKYALIADITCRPVSFEELKQLKGSVSGFEYENSVSFWNTKENEFEVYECIKSPMKHTLLIDRKSNRILHRIEYKA